MVDIARAALVCGGMLLAASTDVLAQNKCVAKGVMGGQPFNLTHCEVAYYESSQGVTVWFTSAPVAAEDRDFFQRSSSADRFNKGRTSVLVGFCPGGGSATPSPATAKSVEINFSHATVANLGPQEQWVLDPAKDKTIRIERLAGDMKKGGKLAGKITGAIPASKFSWDLEFDLTLPEKVAAAGPGC